MGLIKTVLGKTPVLGKNCYLADNATLIGDIQAGDDCSFWFQCVVRADVNAIRIGNKVNIQDGAVIHCTYQKCATTIGNNVSIGHKAIVHGCTIHDNVLIGMGAIVMDNAIVEKYAIVAAGAIVLENTVVESGYIYAGIPAKKIKKVEDSKIKQLIERTVDNYVLYSTWFQEE